MVKKKTTDKRTRSKAPSTDHLKVETIKSDDIHSAADLVPEGQYQKIVYDWNHDDIKKISGMARIGLKIPQIAAVMDCSQSIFDQRIAADKKTFEEGGDPEYNLYCILEKARAAGDGAIARTCYEVALEQKHPTMLIWLSKVRLGWREHIEVSGEVKHTVLYETQLTDGVIRQDQRSLDKGDILDAMIEEITEEACPKPLPD
jgi:hypothetical protein